MTLPLWACGADDLTARMQYTATSFAEPLQRVFDDVLRPDTDIEVTHHEESQYLVDKVDVPRGADGSAIEQDALHPGRPGGARLGAHGVRRAHTGSVHLYLAYGAIGVLLVLLVAAR